MKNTIDALKWRYATKQFDPTKKLSKEQYEIVTEALRLAPSSFGLQPWKFIEVTNPEVRAKLREAAWGQPQITDAANLFVLAVNKNVNDAYVDTYIADIAKTRGMKIEDLKGFEDSIKGSIASKGGVEGVIQWSSRQVYIALGTLLTTAAVEGIDACPMEGFDSKKFDEILGLEKLGLESRVLATVGFRSEGDKAASYKKVRSAKEDVFIELK
jgi:nitroreductase